MKHFLFNIVKLCGVVGAVFIILTFVDITFIGSQYQYSYNASLIDKMDRLKNTKSPKIILVGNSNLAFGIDSEMLEEATGMPVVNMGYLASLGNAFHEGMIKQNVGEGDLVVLAHTTYADDDKIPSIPGAWITLDCHKELLETMRPKDWMTILIGYPNYIRNAILLKITGRGNQDTGDSYSRTAFNSYGDVVRRVESSQMNPDEYFSEEKEVLPEINETCVKRLNDLNQYVESCGAKMVVVAYPIAFGKYTPFTAEDIELFEGSLETELDCDIISNYTDYLYPYSSFYDQVYHLKREADMVHTNQVIHDIRKWENGKGHSSY